MVHDRQVRHAAEWCVRLRGRDDRDPEKRAANRAMLLLFDPSFDYKVIIWSRWVLTMVWNSVEPGDGWVCVDEAVYRFAPGPPMKHLAPIGGVKTRKVHKNGGS